MLEKLYSFSSIEPFTGTYYSIKNLLKTKKNQVYSNIKREKRVRMHGI